MLIGNGTKPLEKEYRLYLNKGTNDEPKYDDYIPICDEAGKPLVLPALASNIVGPQCGIAAHDRNGDGKMFDLVTEDVLDGSALRFYQNVSPDPNKELRFKFIKKIGDPVPVEVYPGHPYRNFYFGDVDVDGIPDIIQFSGSFLFFKGVAPGAPPEITDLSVVASGKDGVQLRWTKPRGATQTEVRFGKGRPYHR